MEAVPHQREVQDGDHDAHPAVVVGEEAPEEDDERGDEADQAEEGPEGDPQVEARAEDPPRVGGEHHHQVLTSGEETDGGEDGVSLRELGVPGVALRGAVLELGHWRVPPGNWFGGGRLFLRTLSCITK